MALIKKNSRETRIAKLHCEVKATYNIVVEKGETFIQINTFGSEDRVINGKASQSIQLSQEVIKELHQLLLYLINTGKIH